MGMKLKVLVMFCVSALVSVTLFQNCSEMAGSDSNNANSVNLGDPADVQTENDVLGDDIPPQTPFAAGETFSAADFPYLVTDTDQLALIAGYSARVGYKAFAMTEDGDFYIASTNEAEVEDQADWDQAILERCQIFFENKPCSLLLSGDVYAQNQMDFENNFVSNINLSAVVDANFQFPGVINHWQNIHSTNYPMFDPGEFKAMALGRNGRNVTGFSPTSQAQASRKALEVCESATDDGCILMAEGINVVLDLNNLSFGQNTIRYAPNTVDVDDIPFIDVTLRNTIRNEYALAINNGFHYALILDRYGQHTRETQNAPFSQAQLQNLIDQCTANLNVDTRECFVYSIDNQIVMTRDSFERAQFPNRFGP
jgi:hypothetical protein